MPGIVHCVQSEASSSYSQLEAGPSGLVSKRFFVNGWVPYVFAFYQDPPAHAFAATEGQRMLVEYLDCLVIVEVGNGDGS